MCLSKWQETNRCFFFLKENKELWQTSLHILAAIATVKIYKTLCVKVTQQRFKVNHYKIKIMGKNLLRYKVKYQIFNGFLMVQEHILIYLNWENTKFISRYLISNRKLHNYLTTRSWRCKGWKTINILQGKMCNKYYKLRKCTPDFCTRALQKVFRQTIWHTEKCVMHKPKTYILAVTEENAQDITPATEILIEYHFVSIYWFSLL